MAGPWDKYRTHGNAPIDMSRPMLWNSDGSFSTEQTIGITADIGDGEKYYNIPTIVSGRRLSEEDAIASFYRGENMPVGVFNTQAEADAAAPQRSQEIGVVRGGRKPWDRYGQQSAPRMIEQRAQNTGYDAARARADYELQQRPTNMTTQLIAPFADEIAGAAGYVSQGVENLGRRVTGQPVVSTAGEAYRAERDATKADIGRYAEENPVRAGTANVLGGFGTIGPGGAFTGGGVTQFLKTMAQGGGLGTAYGAASADPGERLQGAATGGAFGAAIVPALYGVGAVTSPIVRAIANRSRPAPPGAPPGVSRAIANRATNYIGRVMSGAGTSVDDLARATNPNNPITAAEAIGRPGETHLAALARRGGSTADDLAARLTERTAGTGPRMLADIDNATGVPTGSAIDDLRAFTDQLRERAGPLYDAAYATGVPRTRELSALFQSPTMKQALRHATKIAADEQALLRSQGRLGAASSEDWAKAVTDLPNKTAFSTRYLDYVKRGLDDVLEGFRNDITKEIPYGKPAVRAADRVRRQFREHVRTISPRYDEALRASGDYLSIEEAFRDGARTFTNQNVTERQLRGMLENMPPAELSGFRAGVSDALNNIAQRGRLQPGTFSTPIMRGKLSAVFGDDAARTIIAGAEREANLMRAANRMRPGSGSPTAELQQAMREQDGTNSLVSHGLDAITDFATGGVTRVGFGIINNVKNNIRSIYVNGAMPEAVRNEAGRLLMMPPNELAAYMRAIEARPSAATGPQTTVMRLLQWAERQSGPVSAIPQQAPIAGVAAGSYAGQRN